MTGQRFRPLLIVFTWCLASTSLAVPVAAQDGTPAFVSTDREAFIPGLEECATEPLTVEEIDDIANAGIDASPVSAQTPGVPFGAPDGTPADAQTVADMTAVIRGSWACLNGGDWSQFFAYLTPGEIRRNFGPDVAQLANQPVAPFPIENQTAVYAVLDVEALPDGRIGAFVLVDSPGDSLPVEINYQVAVQTDDGLKLDGFICYSGTGTLC